MNDIYRRIARRHIARKSSYVKWAGPLTDVSKLRWQAVFMMGAGGSGKGYVGHRWLKYMPGAPSEGASRRQFDELAQQEMSEQERSLSNITFNKAVDTLRRQGYEIEILPGGSRARIPFRLYTYDHRGAKQELEPGRWKEELPPSVYRDVQDLTEVIFKAPKHELPSYWRQVNPDVYKEELRGYLAEQPGYVHEMSSLMNRAHFHAALESGDPIFVDGTGSNIGKMESWIMAAGDAGYRTTLVLVIVPLIVNQIRNATRPRKVTAPIITGMWGKIKDNFTALRGLADKFHVEINRNDSYDVKMYRQHREKIDAHIRQGYSGKYNSLEDLIRRVAPSEYREWAPKLGWP